MEIIIKTDPKEIAALVAEIRERPVDDESKLADQIIQHLQRQSNLAVRASLR